MTDPAVAFRLLPPKVFLEGPGNALSLENAIVAPYPDGALCWVLENQMMYRLDKTSTAAVSPPDVIATGSGAGQPGRWFVAGLRAVTVSSCLRTTRSKR